MLQSTPGAQNRTAPRPSDLPHLIMAATFIRKMRGEAQAILVEGVDQCLYVVKMMGNAHCSGSLSNELIGGLLCDTLGLSVPRSCFIQISECFLDKYPDAWFDTPDGKMRPPAGLHYGTAFVGVTEGAGRPSELLPAAMEGRVQNRDEFCAIYLFDIWANHMARRQCIYLTDFRRKTAYAVFLDNGLLFGGAPVGFADPTAQAYFRKRDAGKIRWQNAAVRAWLGRFRATIPSTLEKTLKLVPSEWYREDLASLERHLLQRLGVVEELVTPFLLADPEYP